MGPHSTLEETASSNAPRTAPATADADIDLEALAERVFRLIKQEARLERERQGRPPRRRRQVHHGH